MRTGKFEFAATLRDLSPKSVLREIGRVLELHGPVSEMSFQVTSGSSPQVRGTFTCGVSDV